MKIWEKKVKEVAEQLDFEVTHRDNCWRFSQYSPEGQDFNIELSDIENLQQLADELSDYWEGYDVSYETYLWLGNDGHGTNGAPYDMKDVYEDMAWCKEKIEELAIQVNGME